MIRERQRNKLSHSVHMLPHDVLKCSVHERATNKTHVFEEHIGRTMVIDTVVTFDVTGEFGLEDGIGAVFGKTD